MQRTFMYIYIYFLIYLRIRSIAFITLTAMVVVVLGSLFEVVTTKEVERRPEGGDVTPGTIAHTGDGTATGTGNVIGIGTVRA